MIAGEGGGVEEAFVALKWGIVSGGRCSVTKFVHSAVNWLGSPTVGAKTRAERLVTDAEVGDERVRVWEPSGADGGPGDRGSGDESG